MAINLLPQEFRPQKNKQKTKVLMIFGLLFYCLIFVLTNGGLALKIKEKEKELEEWRNLEDEMIFIQAQIEEIEEGINQLLHEKRVLSSLLETKAVKSTELELVTQNLPLGIRLNNVFFGQDGWGRLSGTAESMEDIGRLMEILTENNFRDVHATSVEMNDQISLGSFQIEFQRAIL